MKNLLSTQSSPIIYIVLPESCFLLPHHLPLFFIYVKEKSQVMSYQYYPSTPPISLHRESTTKTRAYSESKTVASRYASERRPVIIGGNSASTHKHVSPQPTRIIIESHKSVQSSPSSMRHSPSAFSFPSIANILDRRDLCRL